MRREEDLDSLAMFDCWVGSRMYVETLTKRKRRNERQVRQTGKQERRAVNGIKNVHTSPTRRQPSPVARSTGVQVANRSQAVICTPMQGFFPDRGVLGRQGRDTDASNGEVRAERQVLGPACGLVSGTKVLSRLAREGRCCVSGGDSWAMSGLGEFGVRPRVPSTYCVGILLGSHHVQTRATGVFYNAFAGQKLMLDSLTVTARICFCPHSLHVCTARPFS